MPVYRNWSQIQSWETRSTTAAPWLPFSQTWFSSEQMVSGNHMPLNFQGDDGGPWYCEKQHEIHSFGNVSFPRLRGQFAMQKPATMSYLNRPGPQSDAELDAFGTTAIARVEPTNPAFSMSQALGELVNDGIPVSGMSLIRDPNLFKGKVNVARSAGSEYLGLQFGWVPLMSDVKKFAHTVNESERILSAYRKGSNTKIRLGYQPLPSQDSRLYQGSNFLPSPADSRIGNITGSMWEVIKTRSWFKGAFRYHVPTSTSQVDKFQEWGSNARKLLGLELTPEVVWNLAPWSWAVDWFTNVGDVLHNVSAMGRDGLVLQYGYSMAERQYECHMIGTNPAPVSRIMRSIYKQRRPATPYGFGANLSTLSPKQVAILAALGLSRT